MAEKIKLTEIRETYKAKVRLKGDEVAEDGSKFEIQEKVRYKEVEYVDGWARFGHYILDMIFFQIISGVLAIIFVITLVAIGIDVSGLAEENNSNDLLIRIINWLIVYPAYYIVFESTVQSTPGKLIMKRVVVNEYGEKPDFMTIVKRSYSRIVPFEAFSCLSTLGWHDTWTDTFVIRKKDLEELRLLRDVHNIS